MSGSLSEMRCGLCSCWCQWMWAWPLYPADSVKRGLVFIPANPSTKRWGLCDCRSRWTEVWALYLPVPVKSAVTKEVWPRYPTVQELAFIRVITGKCGQCPSQAQQTRHGLYVSYSIPRNKGVTSAPVSHGLGGVASVPHISTSVMVGHSRGSVALELSFSAQTETKHANQIQCPWSKAKRRLSIHFLFTRTVWF